MKIKEKWNLTHNTHTKKKLEKKGGTYMHEKDAGDEAKALAVTELRIVVGVGLGHGQQCQLPAFLLEELMLRKCPVYVSGNDFFLRRRLLHMTCLR